MFTPHTYADVCRSLGMRAPVYTRDLLVEWARHNAITADYDVNTVWSSEFMFFAREVTATLNRAASEKVIKGWLYAESDGYRANNCATYRAIVKAAMT